MLHCPICGGALSFREKAARCAEHHSFDIAKEGYVNLLRAAKSGDRIGDNKDAARSRRDFLNKDYYAPLKDALAALFAHRSGSVLDICCGEGYYTAALGRNSALQVYGFDISKEMVRLAAKRGGATYFVANLASIPVADESFDWAIHLFAPFHEREFSRILKPGGTLYSVVPGSRHLWGLKTALYDTPYLNDEALPATELLTLKGKQKVSAGIHLASAGDIDAVFRMTPYFYHTSPADKAKLDGLDSLDTEIEFVIGEYVKP